MKIAVIGKDVSQSLSPKMHTFIFRKLGERCEYDAVSVPPEEFSARAEELFSRYDALNVTIPFKADVIPFLKRLEGDALSFGAANVVLTQSRTGYNTDGYGFLMLLQNGGIEVKGKSVLLLGAGGAGRSCIKKLTEAGAVVSAYERDARRLQQVYEEFGGFTPLQSVPFEAYDVIINCTGIGMHDTVGKTPSVRLQDGAEAPVDERLLSCCKAAVDLIYVPAQSEFLRIAEGLNKQTVNGEAMLFYQAYRGDCIMLNRQPNSTEAKELWKQYQEETA